MRTAPVRVCPSRKSSHTQHHPGDIGHSSEPDPIPSLTSGHKIFTQRILSTCVLVRVPVSCSAFHASPPRSRPGSACSYRGIGSYKMLNATQAPHMLKDQEIVARSKKSCPDLALKVDFYVHPLTQPHRIHPLSPCKQDSWLTSEHAVSMAICLLGSTRVLHSTCLYSVWTLISPSVVRSPDPVIASSPTAPGGSELKPRLLPLIFA